MRTFVAVRWIPEPKLLQVIADIKHALADEAIKWVDEINMHLTLRFIGEISASRLPQINKALSEVAAYYQPFVIQPDSLGVFKKKKHPRILFFNMHSSDYLISIIHNINNRLEIEGFDKDDKKPYPHLTVGRIKYLKNSKHFYQILDDYQNELFQPVTINEIILFKSEKDTFGPVYKKLTEYALSD